MNELMIIAAVALVYVYMVHCKRSALKRKLELSKMLSYMYKNHDLSDDEKRLVSMFYDVVDSWWAIPSLFVAFPLGLFFGKKRTSSKKEYATENSKVIGQYLTKIGETLVVGNPISSLVFLFWALFCAIVFLVITGVKKWLWIVLAFTSPTLVQASPADMAQNVIARTLSAQQHVLHKLRVTPR
ncbi:hypothetical protein ACL00X_06865 [Aeromonas diversa]|uniref:hypothetical protein n=1 Tax=Aeromonas diversa TaxID=502790 RepID=UPI0039A06116